MTYVIAGGSAGLGRALAERFAQAGCELVLLSRDERDTRVLASDLGLRYGVRVSVLALDLGAPALDLAAFDAVLARHRPLRGLLLPAGVNSDADVVGLPEAQLEFLTRANFLSPCKLINHCLPRLQANAGVVIGFGSVATARGRRRNAAYAAAKHALESYFESLAHHAADTGLRCQFYVLGYLDTNLAFGQQLLFPRARPQRLAEIVYRRQHRRGRMFLPRLWYIVFHLVRWLPWAIFKRLSF